jgi:hypothetical protein
MFYSQTANPFAVPDFETPNRVLAQPTRPPSITITDYELVAIPTKNYLKVTVT